MLGGLIKLPAVFKNQFVMGELLALVVTLLLLRAGAAGPWWSLVCLLLSTVGSLHLQWYAGAERIILVLPKALPDVDKDCCIDLFALG